MIWQKLNLYSQFKIFLMTDDYTGYFGVSVVEQFYSESMFHNCKRNASYFSQQAQSLPLLH